MVNNFVQVENLCKTTWKSPCKSSAKKCVQLTSFYNTCAKNNLFTTFSHSFHQVFHNYFIPINILSFPLFHTPYYYNYNIFI